MAFSVVVIFERRLIVSSARPSALDSSPLTFSQKIAFG